MKTYKQTGLDNTIHNALLKQGMMLDKEYCKDMIKAIFEAIPEYLHSVKDENFIKAIKLEYRDFFFCAFIEYKENRYKIAYTFNPEDIKYNFNISESSCNAIFKFILNESCINHQLYFRNTSDVDNVSAIMRECLIAIKNYIESNKISLEDFILMINGQDAMNINELKTGMVAVLRNAEVCRVMMGTSAGDVLVGKDYIIPIRFKDGDARFNEDLTDRKEAATDIVEVYDLINNNQADALCRIKLNHMKPIFHRK
jgi:hypothetical protein